MRTLRDTDKKNKSVGERSRERKQTRLAVHREVPDALRGVERVVIVRVHDTGIVAVQGAVAEPKLWSDRGAVGKGRQNERCKTDNMTSSLPNF